MRFADTNVLLYAASTAPDEREKKEGALAVLDSDDLAVSVQVLQEFYVQATHRSRTERLSHEEAAVLIESWLRFRVEEISITLLRSAMASASRWGIAYWDAAIGEAARAA